MRILNLTVFFLATATFAILPAWTTQAAEPPAPQEHALGKIIRAVAPLGGDGVQRLEITGGEYYFTPNYLVLKVNTPVELKIKKVGGYIPHNLIVKAPEAGIDFKLDLQNDFQNIRFTPTKTGKFPMYCDKSLLWFANHREKGMEGLIEVVE
ncbi:MAG: quinol oxidase [Desulfobulbaceae bacterium]|nr:quinol oxidase [Desulfobulbaceae bacterium]